MTIIEILTTAVTLISLGATAFLTIRSKASGIQQVVIDAQKEQIAMLDRRVTVCEGLHREALNKVGNLMGTVSTMERVLENRDPQLEKTLGAILTFMEKIETYMSAKK